LSQLRFGGAAQRVWKAIVPGQDLPSKEDLAAMAQPHWSEASAAACVQALTGQRERRLAELSSERLALRAQARATSARSLFAGFLFLLAVAILPVGLWALDARLWVFQALLFFAGALAGASGSTLRLLWTREADDTMLRTAVLGLAAGGISAILYLIAQFAANPGILGVTTATTQANPQPALLVFAVAIGFIAGFTSDAVYRKLGQTDVLQTDTVSAKRSG
jgi:hypothetical protein